MKFILVVYLALFSVTGFSEYKPDLKGWTKNYSKDGLDFYYKKVKGSNLLAFKAVGNLPINMGEMMAALRDVEKTVDWEKSTEKKITIENISDIQATTYTVTKVPWPFYNRDSVLMNKLFLDKKDMIFYVESFSVEHEKYPKQKNFVRAHVGYARFRTKPISKDLTYVEFEVQVDPMGSIPDWVVNLVQKDLPYDFLMGVSKYCKKNDLTPNPGVQKMIDEYFKLTGNKLW